MLRPRARRLPRPSSSRSTSSAGVVVGRAVDDAVGLGGLLAEVVDGVVVDAAAELTAAAAAHATTHRFAADPEDLGVDALLAKRRGDLLERAVRAAALVRAPVDEHDLHGESPLCACAHPPARLCLW